MADSNPSVLNGLCSDFNLTHFRQEEFFNFSLDFNLAQKLRPSDFLNQCPTLDEMNFSREDLNKIDILFLSLPYSCSKCLIRFKDISLKYNHNCYVPRSSDNSCYTTHICRCGHITDSHLAFWHHVFVKCFTMTYLYLMMFCMLKKIHELKCFCKEFHSSSDCLSQFIAHWKKCRIAYHAFASHCRHCFNTVRTLRKDHVANHENELFGSARDCPKYSFETPQLSLSFQSRALSHSSMSMVANKSQVFSSSDTTKDQSPIKIFSENFKFGTVSMICYHERATIILPTIHLLENISVKFYSNKTLILVCQTSSVDIQSEPLILRVEKKVPKSDNLVPERLVLNDATSLFFANYLNFYYQTFCSASLEVNRNSEGPSWTRQTRLETLSGSIQRLFSKLTKLNKTHPRNPHPFIEYQEEPEDIMRADKKCVAVNFFKRLKGLKYSKMSQKSQYSTQMLPELINDDVIVLRKTIQIQYLEPSVLPLHASNKEG